MATMVTIPKELYDELRRKAEAYDKMNAGAKTGGKKSSDNLTPEQRRERAKKAVAARIAKYGQKSRKAEQN